ncbi:MAG: hypothetical protein H7Y01_02040 [Ferruginibacter sp.]|nr:hypothetical protein [Chitinophagaceae bacterium]
MIKKVSIPSKETVVSAIEIYLKINLLPVSGKKVFYSGNQNKNKEIIVCTPQSKLHATGFGWIDITTKQAAMLENTDTGILAFRLEGNKVYYIHFKNLKKYLIEDALINNNREGDHWKLRIWPDNIQVIGNSARLQIHPNNITDI